MSIATELARIQGAKSDLKTSIEAKGVAVPSSTLISGYAVLVDQISGGGGLPDSDGLVGLVVANGDQSGSSSFSLTYLPTYHLRYVASTAVSSLSGLTIPQTSVTYPAITWSCDNPSLTISGNTVTVPLGTDGDVTFTATWTDIGGNTQTTSKTIHVDYLRYQMMSATSWYIGTGYLCLGTEVSINDIKCNGYTMSHADWYNNRLIARCTYAGTYVPTWNTFSVMTNTGTSASVFATIDECKAAIDSM